MQQLAPRPERLFELADPKLYASTKPSQRTDLERQIGREIADLVKAGQCNTRDVLNAYRDIAPTQYEYVTSGRYNIDVKAGAKLPRTLVTDFTRQSVLMRTIRLLGEELFGHTYEQYRQFRDTFNAGMKRELDESDEFWNNRATAPRVQGVSAGEDVPAVQKEPPRYVTHDDFIRRLEDHIVRMVDDSERDDLAEAA